MAESKSGGNKPASTSSASSVVRPTEHDESEKKSDEPKADKSKSSEPAPLCSVCGERHEGTEHAT
jgi:hypothetical protein